MQPMQKSFVAMMITTTRITTMSATKPVINLFRVAKQGESLMYRQFSFIS